MEYERLENEIKSLIELHAEGIYWDFKKQWHEKNSDLLHDIICMANSPANRDCYIIIGVEDGTYIPCGVENVNRKNQQNVIDLLRQKEYLFRSHDYRHGVATRFYDSGVSIQGVRDYLGHAYEEMTRQYIDYMPDRIDRTSGEFFAKPGNSLMACLKGGGD